MAAVGAALQAAGPGFSSAALLHFLPIVSERNLCMGPRSRRPDVRRKARHVQTVGDLRSAQHNWFRAAIAPRVPPPILISTAENPAFGGLIEHWRSAAGLDTAVITTAGGLREMQEYKSWAKASCAPPVSSVPLPI